MELQTVHQGEVVACLAMSDDGVLCVEITDAVLGDAVISGFLCEAEARSFLELGDFRDCPDNAAVAVAGMTGLRWR